SQEHARPGPAGLRLPEPGVKLPSVLFRMGHPPESKSLLRLPVNARLNRLVRRKKRVAKDIRLQLDLFQPTLDRIANANDTNQLTLLNHRQVPNPALRHLHHRAFERIFASARDDLTSHQVLGLECEQGSAVIRQRTQNITFREYTDNGLAIRTNDNSAN